MGQNLFAKLANRMPSVTETIDAHFTVFQVNPTIVKPAEKGFGDGLLVLAFSKVGNQLVNTQTFDETDYT